jgi:penicillin amidase
VSAPRKNDDRRLGDGVSIRRDAAGVRHVIAKDADGLFRGMGYCHARDRGLQLLLMRILAQGRTCECLVDSDDAFEFDCMARRQHFYADAVEQAERLTAEARTAVDAYCAGVDEALRQRVPWELRLFRYRPEPWTPADSVALFRMTAYLGLDQAQGDMERLLIEMVQAGVSRKYLDALFPDLLDDLDEDLVRRIRLGKRVVPNENPWAAVAHSFIASNNWVVSGAKTKSGRALMANDPHLEGNRLPGVWYEIVLELPERWCIASTMPGLPGPAIGRTDDLAWGATYSFMDTTDSWIEDCRGGCYRRGDGESETWVPFRTRTESVKRRKNADATLIFYENEHGTLDGDPTVAGHYLATRWAPGSGTGARSIEAPLAVLHATNVEQGMQVLGTVETAWNWVLADSEDNIGYQMSGCMPRRKEGSGGLAPLPGWDPANDWNGFVDPEQLPRQYNPECGFIVTANQQLGHLGLADPINLPMSPYRADRISAELAKRNDWDIETTCALQMDTYSLQAQRYMAVLAPLLPDDDNGRALKAWDCRYDPSSVGASLFERFYRALIVETLGRVCGPDPARFLLEETTVIVDFHANFDAILLDENSPWHGEEGRDATFRRVANRTLAGPAERWGDQRRFTMKHILFGGRLPRWSGFDFGPFELPGGRATPHQGQIFRAHGRETTFMPSYRIVTDFAEDAAHTCLLGGPSDRRFSRWYTAGIEDSIAGRFKKLVASGCVDT